MFWSGNFMAVRELNSLLKGENVSLSQVLEADDILQECKTDNANLIQFITRPDILGELMTLITQEPSQDEELSLQYRHANIASEVLSSQLPNLNDRLSADVVQMNRLCDFLAQEPPLNPLLASYFSKTIEMLLARNPKQDCYLYHIVCLRVIDFFKSRRDFLPNLLRHMSTSSIVDTFRFFIDLDDVFSKVIMEWFDEHCFLESLIEIICGTYNPEPLEKVCAGKNRPNKEDHNLNHINHVGMETHCSHPMKENHLGDSIGDCLHGEQPKISNTNETNQHNHQNDDSINQNNTVERIHNNEEVTSDDANQIVNKDNASVVSLEVDKAKKGDNSINETNTPNSLNNNCTDYKSDVNNKNVAVEVVNENSGDNRLCDDTNEDESRKELTEKRKEMKAQSIRDVAASNAAALLCTIVQYCMNTEEQMSKTSACDQLTERVVDAEFVRSLLAAVFTSPPRSRETAVVAGCKLLLAMLQAQDDGTDAVNKATCPEDVFAEVEKAVAPHLPLLHTALLAAPAPYPHCPQVERVGAARLQVVALLAKLASSQVEEVVTTMLTLGTPNVLFDMFFKFPNNNLLHGRVLAFVRAALYNQRYGPVYAEYFLKECDLLTRLMALYEENEAKKVSGGIRDGSAGHAAICLWVWAKLERPPEPALPRWAQFQDTTLNSIIETFTQPLGGIYPSETTYETEGAQEHIEINHELVDASAVVDIDVNMEDASGKNDGEGMCMPSKFMEMVRERFNNDLWEDSPEGEGFESLEDEESAEGTQQHTLQEVLSDVSPWDNVVAEDTPKEEGWAQFDAFNTSDNAFYPDSLSVPQDPFVAPTLASDPFMGVKGSQNDLFGDFVTGPQQNDFTGFWSYREKTDSQADDAIDNDIAESMQSLHLDDSKVEDSVAAELTNNLLTAMSSMSPEIVANIVNSNLSPHHAPVGDQLIPSYHLEMTQPDAVSLLQDPGADLDVLAPLQDNSVLCDQNDVTVPIAEASVSIKDESVLFARNASVLSEDVSSSSYLALSQDNPVLSQGESVLSQDNTILKDTAVLSQDTGKDMPESLVQGTPVSDLAKDNAIVDCNADVSSSIGNSSKENIDVLPAEDLEKKTLATTEQR